MSDIVHQTVHGYHRGHTELASSTNLERTDSDLLTRLSDLSGALLQSQEFNSYLSFYPLPSNSFYAIGQTWLDDEAPRTGCVLTHTLLVPVDVWGTMKDPHAFAALLHKPARDDLSPYSVPLDSPSSDSTLPTTASGPLEDFVFRFYGEGTRPLVWFEPLAADIVAWHILQSSWPSLRKTLAMCTYALKPRALDQRPFDVLFAPEQARSRFADYTRQHVVAVESSARSQQERWLRRWSHFIFGASSDEVDRARIHLLSQNLEENPSSIRKVFLYLDLSEQATRTPMAAIGALDVLETLALGADSFRSEAMHLVQSTLQSADTASDVDKIELLYLLSERISNVHDIRIEREISTSVSSTLRSAPEKVWAKAEEVAGRHSNELAPAFLVGLVNALQERASARPSPSYLPGSSAVGRLVLTKFPETARHLLRAARDSPGSQIRNILLKWCAEISNPKARIALRLNLVPCLENEDIPIAEELLRDLDSSEALELCNAIESAASANSKDIARICAQAIAKLRTPDIYRWALDAEAHTYFSAFLLGLTLPIQEEALIRLLSQEMEGKHDLAVAVFLERALDIGTPRWLEAQIEGNAQLWTLLLKLKVEDIPTRTILDRICSKSKRSAIAQTPHLAINFLAHSAIVQSHAVTQWIKDWIDREDNENTIVATQQDTQWFLARLVSDISPFSSVLLERTSWTNRQWQSAWGLADRISATSGGSCTLFGAIDHLLRYRPREWGARVPAIWCSIIKRAEASPAENQQLCVQATKFCLDHAFESVADVIGSAFFTAHNVALNDKSQSFNLLFGLVGWDRALELRRRLVNTFHQGQWPSEFFVLAAHSPWLLRKLCRRMMRQWKGYEFLQQAYDAILRNNILVENDLLSELRNILEFPQYEEEWD